MTDILKQIISHKRREVAIRKKAQPMKRLLTSGFFDMAPLSFKESIRDRSKAGIIAEFKRRSPVAGMLHATADAGTVTGGYAAHGASALSVLTDEDFFGGGSYDFGQARQHANIPLLRKDFIIDEYQVVESRAMGADAILLIAAALSPNGVRHFARLAHVLQMQVLLEIRSRDELDRLCPSIDLIGVNNRCLKTFTTDLQRSVDLAEHLPAELVKISESGIRTAEDISRLSRAGFDGFLIGSLFMKEEEPHKALANLIHTLGQ